MNFSLTDEQQMLVDSLDRFIENDYSFASRRALIASSLGYSRDHWRFLAEMGLLGLTIPEAQGGMGKGAQETYLVMRSLGRGLVLEPYIPSAVVAPAILTRGGSAAQQAQWLPGIASGDLQIALAVDEPDTHYDPQDMQTRLAGGRLNGRKSVVLGGASADRFIVAARDANGGFVLACIDARAPGVVVEAYSNIDNQRSAEVSLTEVAISADELLGAPADSLELLEWGLDHGRAALCAESVGVMELLYAKTLDYMKTRVQFKKAIGSNQALQHRAVEMMLSVEQAQSVALLTAAHVAHPQASVRQKAISTAKAQVGHYGRHIGEAAIQISGGMGMTDEFEAGHYFKRLLAIDLTWGDSAYHLQRYISLEENHP